MGSARRFYGPAVIHECLPARVRWRLAWSITRTLAQGTWDEAAVRAARLSPLVCDLLVIAEGLAIERILFMTCRGCGCTKRRACPGGCAWAAWELCSACAPFTEEEREELRAAARAQLNLPPLTMPITREQDLYGDGVRVFKVDRFGRYVDSLLVDPEEDAAAAGDAWDDERDDAELETCQ